MPSTLKTCAILALGLLGVANAHVKMASPVPFNVANLDNSPLKADGSDFPCKASTPSSYSISAMNELPVDKPILLSLRGSAIHGGGTCQLSITFDDQPTKESVFKVIQTFEGNCPPTNDAKLTFSIPNEFPNAENATLAWTWFNFMGNREMYMNCAPISVTGGSDSKDYYDSLPDMFVANLATTECAVLEGGDVEVPNAGEFVLQAPSAKLLKPDATKCPAKAQANNAKSGQATNFAAYTAPAADNNKVVPLAGGAGNSGASPSVPAVGGGGNDGMYTPPAAAPSQPSPTTASPNNGLYSQPAAPAAPSSSSSAAVSAPVPTISAPAPTASAPAPTASAPAPTTSTPPAAHSTFKTMTIPASSATTSSAPPPAYPTLSPSMGQGVSGPSSGGSAASPTGSPSSSSASNAAAGSSTTCTTEGAVVCNGTDQFGLCDHGSIVWQKVASGTTCSNGSIQKRSAAQHIRRHAHGAFKVRAS
jgi:hypothetical protein